MQSSRKRSREEADEGADEKEESTDGERKETTSDEGKMDDPIASLTYVRQRARDDVSEMSSLLATRLGQSAPSNPFNTSLQGRPFSLHQIAQGLSSQRLPPLGASSSRGGSLLGANPFASVAFLQHARDMERNQILQSTLLGHHGTWPSVHQAPPQILPGLGRSAMGASGFPSSSSHMPGAVQGGGRYPFLHSTGSSHLNLSTQNRLLAAALQQQISLQQNQHHHNQQQHQVLPQQATSLAAAARSRASPTGAGITNTPPAASLVARRPSAAASAARPEAPASAAPPPSFARRTASSSVPTRERLTMYISCDDDSLTAYQCLARKQIELFEAGPVEVEAGTQGRNRTIISGQVGIRCRHCSHLPLRERAKGSTFYPSKLSGLYQAAQNMTNSHLAEHCQHVPPAIREELAKLGNKKSSAGGGKDYWASGAKMLGVIEDDHGLRFGK